MIFQTLIGGYSSLELVSWANGTPAQLAAMLDAHYAGRINIANYWSVGDTRTVAIGAIEANNSTAAMAAQTAQLVLMNLGGKTLVTAEHGQTNCACIVGFKNCLTTKGKYHTSTSSVRYSNSAIRQFLNNQLFLALPSDMQALFKSFVNKTGYSSSALEDTEDLLALPATIEVLGSKASGEATGEGSLFSYYATAANRIKTVSGAESIWWNRSIISSSPSAISTSGTHTSYSATVLEGLSPFGVI